MLFMMFVFMGKYCYIFRWLFYVHVFILCHSPSWWRQQLKLIIFWPSCVFVDYRVSDESWSHTGHQMSQGRKKHMARPGLEPRTSRIPCEHSDHWATEPNGRPVTISPCLIRFVPESARNHAGTDETVPLLLAARATPPHSHTGHQIVLPFHGWSRFVIHLVSLHTIHITFLYLAV